MQARVCCVCKPMCGRMRDSLTPPTEHVELVSHKQAQKFFCFANHNILMGGYSVPSGLKDAVP